MEELVSQGQDLTRSDDVGQASIFTIVIPSFLHYLILKVLDIANVPIYLKGPEHPSKARF